MTRLTRLCRAVGVGIAVTTATLAMTQVANAAPKPPPTPPAPPAGNEPFLVGHAKGVQTYACTNGQLATTGSVPTAELRTDNKQVIQHFVGPTWKNEADGSAVSKNGVVTPANSDDPAKNIPWLLVPVGPAPGSSNDPGDLLTGTTFIQRVNTKGGVSPGGPCTADLAVKYKADYVFFKATAPAPAPA